jgi:hypothetical protein
MDHDSIRQVASSSQHSFIASQPYYTLPVSSPSSHQIKNSFSHFVSTRTFAVCVDINDSEGQPLPSLRKKPNLNASNNARQRSGFSAGTPMRQPASVPSLSQLVQDALHSAENINSDAEQSRPSTSGGIDPPGTPLHRTSSSSLQRSPSQKKPPASHSSYGVETTCGPPPSFSTQRTLSQDRIRISSTALRAVSPTKNKRNESPPKRERPLSPLKIHESASKLESPNPTLPNLTSTQDLSSTESSSTLPSPDTPDTALTNTSQNIATMPSSQELEEKESAEVGRLGRPAAGEDDGKGSSSDEKKSEDLFLNIAKTDASTSRVEKRRSRVSLPFFSNRPATAQNPSPLQDRFDTASVSGRSEALKYYSKRSSLGQHVPGAFSRTSTLGEPTRDSRFETQSAHPAELSRKPTGRRFSIANSNAGSNIEAARPYSRPNTARTNRLVSEASFLDRPKMPEPNATESTISTTAPSTVWDELDDLKSRIRKLELTGKLPPSSAAAMTSSDRPKTATTAATTMSGSPKHKPVATPQLQSAIEGIPSGIHPNLHEALSNAKNVLSNDVYQKLQATAQDALQLSMMMNPEGTVGSTVGTPGLSERQIRRRTESLCRSLTELAISMLSEPKSTPQPATRPASREAYQSISGLRSRRYSNEQSDRPPVTSRVQSRLETRRTSTLNTQSSPSEVYQTPPAALPQVSTSSASRVTRTASTLVRSRLTPAYGDGTAEDETNSPSIRPVSRAMTEVSNFRSRTRNGAEYSREYTAQHPLPAPPAAESNTAVRSQLPSHLVPRRKYATPPSAISNVGSQGTPVTPKEPWGRISIVPATMSSPIEATPEALPSPRPASTRRSLGFTSRISSVSSRLRAAKAERTPSNQYLDPPPSVERQGSGQSTES